MWSTAGGVVCSVGGAEGPLSGDEVEPDPPPAVDGVDGLFEVDAFPPFRPVVVEPWFTVDVLAAPGRVEPEPEPEPARVVEVPLTPADDDREPLPPESPATRPTPSAIAAAIPPAT
jgi:hypothetical protein